MKPATCLIVLVLVAPALAQEQIDKADPAGKAPASLAAFSIRVRVSQVEPQRQAVQILWRRGGEGLGGNVTRGQFSSAAKAIEIAIQEWSAPVPLKEIAGGGGAWQFPTVVLWAGEGKKAVPLKNAVVEFELLEKDKPIKAFTEIAPGGATVSFVVPGRAGTREELLTGIVGVSEHARRRRQLLENLCPQPVAPRHFGIIGHLAGFGEGSGYGIRHCNPAIVADECAALQRLGVNGLVSEKSVKLADAAGVGGQFRRVYWGGPGSGSPMNFIRIKPGAPEPCPYDPQIAQRMKASVEQAIAEHRAIGAKQSWALWWDEIGVAAKEHLETCPRCRQKFVEYLQRQKLQPAEVGASAWEEVRPFPAWSKGWKGADPARDGLRCYYTSRFMTEVTAQLFVDAAKQFKEAGILLYAMQGPTPSWAGHSLDWHEFYDRGANTAFVFETSNRDPRAWAWESYLADIGRGICARHGMPMGVLVKPHRGAVAQRMLSVVARGASVIEWYTYGPDYAKGDSFSQSPELLEQVSRAARFLATNEDALYGATWAGAPEVALVSPRSGEIWGRATELGVMAFENAKWVYLALLHAQVPVDILSEQQLAEGKLGRYKVIYVPGTHLERAAQSALMRWVGDGGTLWTDALGMAWDAANQPSPADGVQYDPAGKTVPLVRAAEVEPYKATQLKPFKSIPGIDPAKVRLGQRSVAVGPAWHALEGSEPDGLTMYETPAGEKRAIAIKRSRAGRGEVVRLGFFAGLAYSATVRREDYDMSADFDADLRQLIAGPAMDRGVYRPVVVSSPLVEAVALAKEGKRSVALINWGYRHRAPGQGAAIPLETLRIELRSLGPVRNVISAALGKLAFETRPDGSTIATLPTMGEIDLLRIE